MYSSFQMFYWLSFSVLHLPFLRKQEDLFLRFLFKSVFLSFQSSYLFKVLLFSIELHHQHPNLLGPVQLSIQSSLLQVPCKSQLLQYRQIFSNLAFSFEVLHPSHRPLRQPHLFLQLFSTVFVVATRKSLLKFCFVVIVVISLAV